MKNFHQVTKDLNFVILYGSQLGQAKSISEGLVDVALREHDLKTALFSLNDVEDISDLPKLKIPIVIVTSTTGDGDPPENADKFWRKIRRKNLSSNSLLLVRYAILGLGDTNFNNFCNCGKTIHKQFQELGATLFYPPGWADDGTGLDIVVDDWIQGLWPALKKSLGIFKLNQLCNTSNNNCNSSSAKSSFQASKLSNQSEVTSSLLVKSSGEPIKTIVTRENPDNLTFKEHNNESTQVKSNNLGLGNEMEKENKSSESAVSSVKIDPQPIVATTTTTITKTLTLPPKPASSVILEFGANKSDRNSYDKLNPPAAYPLIDGSPLEANISGAKLLTKNNSVKTTVQVTLDLGETVLDYEPGDSIGIICPNPASEIRLILKHLGLEEKSDVEVSIKLNPSVAKGKIPLHLPKEAVSLRDYFTWVCDIRSPPKKALLRLLAENTSDEGERSILLELCSKEGAKLYTEKIFDPGMSLLDIFLAYPTCKPPVEALVEHLPRLQPRAYSICSSPYSNARENAENSENSISRNSFNVAFNIIEIPKDKARQYNRLGVASGWMFHFCRKNRLFGDNFDAEFENDFINSLELNTEGDDDTHNQEAPVSNTVVIYKRKNQNFRLPTDLTKSVIMVGPGTGVAPFIGFLEHREHQRKQNGGDIGKIYLYFGCRNRDKDFLYEEELTAFVDSGLLTKFYGTFSRDDGPEQSSGIKYVQDLIKKNEEEVVSPLLDEEGYLYVCGDEKNMAKDVRETLAAAIEHVKGLDSKDAMANIANLVMSKRYLQDLWA